MTVLQRVRLRLYGVLFLVVLASLVELSIAFYNKDFTKVVMVTLTTDSTGNQLQAQSDVKIRGILVGEVRKISSTGHGAKLELALDPSRAALIDNNYRAQLLPKTLFGEDYVSLVITPPSTPVCGASAPGGVRPVHKGDVLCQDTSVAYSQLENVLSDVMPLLQALKPAELSLTLHALATALDGRGAQLGKNLVQLDDYLSKLNPHLGTLVDDIDKLGAVSSEYNAVAPALLSTLDNLQTTSKTITQNPDALAALLTSATATSAQLTGFFDESGSRLITVASQSKQLLALLAEYSPEYPCMAAGLVANEAHLEQAFRNHALNMTLEVVTSRGKYVPGNEPKIVTGVGPQCYGLPNPAVPFPGVQFPDGAPPLGPGAASTSLATDTAYSQSQIGSSSENHLVDALISDDYGNQPSAVPPVATMLAAPLLRGNTAVVSP